MAAPRFDLEVGDRATDILVTRVAKESEFSLVRLQRYTGRPDQSQRDRRVCEFAPALCKGLLRAVTRAGFMAGRGIRRMWSNCRSGRARLTGVCSGNSTRACRIG